MDDRVTPPGGYGSARDVPSIAKMLQEAAAFKRLTRIVARRLRPEIIRLEQEVLALTAVVDRFYEIFGDRNWIFHDDLNVELVTVLVASDLPIEKLEQQLIEELYEPERLSFMISRLNSHPALQSRMELLRRAEADYREGRYYATVLVLIAVMDGFVNDLEPGNRKGLHAREEAELVAWDSVIGHHKGLASTHAAFTRSFKRTITEPVYELHRNGIVHGNLTNFDNVIVATKAWNRLFAVADWARARVRQSHPEEPPIRWRQLIAQITENAKQRKQLDDWRPSALHSGDDAFNENPMVQTAVAFLDAWQHKRWGLMAPMLPLATQQALGGRVGQEIREMYSGYDLQAFTVREAAFVAAAACELTADLRVDGRDIKSVTRWIRESQTNSEPVLEPGAGVWRLPLWGVHVFTTEHEDHLSQGEAD